MAANVLPPAMRAFRKQRPDVRIQLFDADLPTLIRLLETGKLDVSLGIFKGMVRVRREPFFRLLSDGGSSGRGRRAAPGDNGVDSSRRLDADLAVRRSSTSTTHRQAARAGRCQRPAATVVRFDFHLISSRGKELPPGAVTEEVGWQSTAFAHRGGDSHH